ncbi:MAG: response regulator [Halochromatium sp.]|uniref:response regulator n=1 Tax=Halochromatium sp. TaxID=2049430 RepID=UPI003979AD8C
MSERILIVEDETRLATLLADYLRAAGFATEQLADGRDVFARVRAEPPALMLLDLMLPGRDGLEICRELRHFTSLPIIMTTARVEEIDRLLGLELGADDYICKPYSPREVVARVKAVLRRGRQPDTATTTRLQLDADRLRVRLGEASVELTAIECGLLATLLSAPGRIFSREQLIARSYRDHRIVSDRTIDSHVKKLRRKLAALDPALESIHSVYGVGYRYEESNALSSGPAC